MNANERRKQERRNAAELKKRGEAAKQAAAPFHESVREIKQDPSAVALKTFVCEELPKHLESQGLSDQPNPMWSPALMELLVKMEGEIQNLQEEVGRLKGE